MKAKKVLYYIPIILLIIYIIIYVPLLRYLINKYVDGVSVIFTHDCNNMMDKISISVIAIASMIKLIFRKSKCEINKKESIINLIIFIILICVIFFLEIITNFA